MADIFKDLYRATAKSVFQRELQVDDGLADDFVVRSSSASVGVIPLALRDYYSVLGSNAINSACNHLRSPLALQHDPSGRYIVFLEENQSVCVWGYDVADETNTDPTVYQGVLEQNHWVSEDCTLSEFLVIMFYYQCASDGLKFTGCNMTATNVLQEVEGSWDKVVDHNGLRIWLRDGMLIEHLAGQRYCTAAANRDDAIIFLKDHFGFQPV